MDLFYIDDPLHHRTIPILNMVDLGTNYQMIEPLQSKEASEVWQKFWATWCRTFGLPQYLSLDEGMEFRGDFSHRCAESGILVFRAAGRAPWQAGKVERHGGLMKTLIEKTREASPVDTMDDLRCLLHECESIKNRLMNRSGFSPVQRQIGQWPRVAGSLMSDELLDPALQLQDTSDEFDRMLALRQAAQEAFAKLSSKEAAAKSLRARPRLQRTFKAGDIVYVHRFLRKRKGVRVEPGAEVRERPTPRRATWIGPGHVLAMEGSVVWINMFGELWRAAVNRPEKQRLQRSSVSRLWPRTTAKCRNDFEEDRIDPVSGMSQLNCLRMKRTRSIEKEVNEGIREFDSKKMKGTLHRWRQQETSWLPLGNPSTPPRIWVEVRLMRFFGVQTRWEQGLTRCQSLKPSWLNPTWKTKLKNKPILIVKGFKWRNPRWLDR